MDEGAANGVVKHRGVCPGWRRPRTAEVVFDRWHENSSARARPPRAMKWTDATRERRCGTDRRACRGRCRDWAASFRASRSGRFSAPAPRRTRSRPCGPGGRQARAADGQAEFTLDFAAEEEPGGGEMRERLAAAFGPAVTDLLGRQAPFLHAEQADRGTAGGFDFRREGGGGHGLRLRAGGRGFFLTGKTDGDLFAGRGAAPERNRAVALEHRAVPEDLRQTDVGPREARGENGGGEERADVACRHGDIPQRGATTASARVAGARPGAEAVTVNAPGVGLAFTNATQRPRNA